MRYIGAHVSASGGLDKAVVRANDLGANALQVFTGSPRVWKSKAASEFDYESFLETRKKLGVEKAVIHATYLVNLASDNPLLVEKSRQALINDLNVASRGDFEGVVVHLGSHQGRGYDAMRKQMIEEIKKIIDQSDDKGIFLIENSAGQNGKIASDFEHVADLIEAVGSERLGWCMDTCHAHAAGYSLGVGNLVMGETNLFSENQGNTVKNVKDELDRLGLLQSLKCIHLNDSKDPFDSGRDRHENLGEGSIGLGVLGAFIRDPQLTHVPLILEVPGFDGSGPDERNMDILSGLLKEV